MFKVGDKLKIKEGMWSDLDYTRYGFNKDTYQIVSAVFNGQYPSISFVGSGYRYDAAYFELVTEEKVKAKRFATGDKVISIKNTPEVPEGFVGYIVEDPLVDVVGRWDYAVRKENHVLQTEYFTEDELELLSVGGKEKIQQLKEEARVVFDGLVGKEECSIARPVLEERKIGKVKMELFDEGFPNAIMEIARVMTWAAEHKGYKPHDWKNLPNADTEFSAAASRHKVKGFIQKVEGVEPLQRTDEESKIVHLAHQAFNVLAELELVLTGVIK